MIYNCNFWFLAKTYQIKEERNNNKKKKNINFFLIAYKKYANEITYVKCIINI